jgi:glucose/arabinose dehydrogenase/PKD repeat protein/type 1 glutamine amidotransferase
MTALRRSRRGRSVAALAAGALAITLAPTAVATATPADTSVETAPSSAEVDGDSRVLIFTATTQFRHTEAITQGTPVLEAAFAEAGIASDHTEDASVFNDDDLAAYDALVMFQTSGDPWSAEQKAALERYQQNGGGIAAIHNATDMRGEYAWWDEMIGSLMPGHAATGTSPGLPGTVRVEDRTHPSTAHLPQRWDRADEWYNFSTNVRGDAHVLATMDESTYDPGGNAMGADHPISWCKAYDGGRAWMTGMGHFGAHYTQESDLVQHIVGGVEWAAGLAEGDCGGTDWDQYEKVALDSNTSAPFAMDVAPDGRVFFTELVRGQIRVFDPRTQTTTTALTIPVYSGGEDGLLGIALDRDFAENGYLYQYYSPASEDDTDPASFFNRLSRFTVTGSEPGATVIDPDSEVVLLDVPARRLPDEPGHTGGGLVVDHESGDLYLGVGDDVNPHSEPSGGYAPLSEREGTFHDARETSANTNDLRGKILRIHPEDDGTYSIPEGNLFPEAEDTDDKTLPEIYAMGFRNPFRFSIDPHTGDLGMADYSPDNGSDNPAQRGPAGIAEWNLISEPGFYGWPLCMGDNEPFRDVDYTTNPVTVGDFFDCDAPVNDSVRNTGLTELPPAQPADLYYGYQRTSAPGVINAGGGLAPMGGPFYDYDPELDSDTKFPEFYDGKPFFYEWSRNRMYSLELKDPRAGAGGSDVEKVNPFLPTEEFLAPIDSRFGPDGSMYVLDWGGGFGRHNPDSGLHRIDYVTGSRSPSAVIAASPDSGQAPLEVTLDGTGSSDPEGEELTYAWDVDGDGTVDSTDATTTHTFTENGVYDVRLTVTDPHGKTGTTTVPVTVGNTQPEVEFTLPPNGSFFEFGDTLSWDVTVTDAEDSPDGSAIDDSRVIIQPALGHDAHAHPADPLSGRTGSVETDLGGGHSDDMNVFYVLDARYEDDGGDGVPTLTGSDTSLIFPKQREAEFFTDSEGTTTSPSRDSEGHGSVISGSDGAWASYDPVNLFGIDALTLRVAAAEAGQIELRRGAVDGELIGVADVPETGLSTFTDVRVDISDPGETFTLVAVFPGSGERRLNFIEANGKGVSDTTRPEVAITAPQGGVELDQGEIAVTAEASDAENTITEVEFFVDGTSLGTDGEAPYEAAWTVDEDGYYELTAVATNDRGVSTTSRIVLAQVGNPFNGLQQFSNAAGQFETLGGGAFAITSGGANMWQGTDEYSSLYREGVDDTWSVTVRVDSQENSHGSAKAGIIVRNDVTQPGASAGYAALGIRPSNGFEWLRGNAQGQLVESTGAGSTDYPAWMRLVRDGDLYTAYWSLDGEEFTQVGEPVTLPGAASVQDVGMFVTAHSTSATSRVEFADFVFDDDPGEPGEPDTVEVTATAEAVCVGKNAVVRVSLENGDGAAAEIVVETPYGTKRYPDVQPGDTPMHPFRSKERSIEAGTVQVTATVEDRTQVLEVEYDAADCT